MVEKIVEVPHDRVFDMAGEMLQVRQRKGRFKTEIQRQPEASQGTEGRPTAQAQNRRSKQCAAARGWRAQEQLKESDINEAIVLSAYF